uniref:Uncharacterized protein n=1 Tax=Clytia hemisphaerica TaxID=252671 RepID=A0A7M5VFR2_9CNID
MPVQNLSLKPSAQSLFSRGLPQHIDTPRTAVSSIISSGSETEKKIESLNNGLDRCSSILNALLTENNEMPKKPKKTGQRVKIVSPKKTKDPQPPKKNKSAPYNKRLVSSTPTPKNQNKNQQKKIVSSKKNIGDVRDHSQEVLCKDDISSNTVEELIEERDRLKEYLKTVSQQKAQVEAEVQHIVANGPPKNYQNISETQRKDSSPNRLTPEKLFENHTNLLEELMKSISDKLTVTTDLSSLSTKSQMNTSTNRLSDARTIGRTESPKRLPTMTLIDFHNGENHQTAKSVSSIKSDYEQIENTRIPNIESYNNANLPFHLEKLDQIHQKNISQNFERSIEIGDTTARINAVQVANKLTQTPDKAKPSSPNSRRGSTTRRVSTSTASLQIVTLTYLMKELYKVLSNKRDLELDNLLQEIDHVIQSLPFSLDTDVDPKPLQEQSAEMERLEKENKLLKRREEETEQLMVQAKFESEKEKARLTDEFQRLLEERENKLTDDHERQKQLAAQVNHVTEELRNENQRLFSIINEQSATHFDEQQQWKIGTGKVMKELDLKDTEIAALKIQLQTQDKEKHFLEVSSKQKDTEIERLTTLNKDLQNSISNLLEDIESERAKNEVKRQQKPLSEHRSTRHNIDSRSSKGIGKRDNRDERKLSRSKHEPKPIDSAVSNSLSIISSESNTLSTVSNTLSSTNTNSSVSTLKTFDNIEFQNDMIHLETKIDVLGDALYGLQKQKISNR